MSALGPALARLADGARLTAAEAEQAFSILMDGGADDAQIAAFLMALRVRGETIDEIAAGARVLRARATSITAPEDVVDTCGTGGDGAGTFNISTAAALVAAGAGVRVAKHGNRAVSSQSGSSDVLTALGVDVGAGAGAAENALRQVGLAFLFAPSHHAAMRHVAEARRSLGLRTIFNLIGPLSNPAGARRQVLGVYAADRVRPMAEALAALGAEKAWVVHGADGLDELTTTGPSRVAALDRTGVREFAVTPEEVGLPRARPDDLRGGDAAANARAIRDLLNGRPGPFRDIVLLNAAAAIVVADRAGGLGEGVAAARTAIDTGAARAALEGLVLHGQRSAP